MPDKWEYPWFAAWDLAFHCVALAHVDPAFAKEQLRLITREWYMHANGQLPAYEWDFGDVNPPVHALAALRVFQIDGSRDVEWLQRIFHKMLLGFTWWANAKDPEGDNLFGGGFLGLDNIGPFDRSSPLPDGHVLEQADGTGWMAFYCLGDARDRARAGGPRPGLRGRRGEVLRALHPHPAGHQRDGPLGRGRRLLLRPDPPRVRRLRAGRCGPAP